MSYPHTAEKNKDVKRSVLLNNSVRKIHLDVKITNLKKLEKQIIINKLKNIYEDGNKSRNLGKIKPTEIVRREISYNKFSPISKIDGKLLDFPKFKK
jgi:hypothetical protein